MTIKAEITVGSEEEFENLLRLIDEAEMEGELEHIQVQRLDDRPFARQEPYRTIDEDAHETNW